MDMRDRENDLNWLLWKRDYDMWADKQTQKWARKRQQAQEPVSRKGPRSFSSLIKIRLIKEEAVRVLALVSVYATVVFAILLMAILTWR